MNYIVNIETPQKFQDLLTIRQWFSRCNTTCYKVNQLYLMMLQEKGVTHRPGWKFMFWFACEGLAEKFKNNFNGEFVHE